ncbi:MAG: YfiR family protein [Aestuariibacter sp.]
MVKHFYRQLAFCLLLLVTGFISTVQAQSFKPEQLRTSFLFHIVHYTNYPESTFSGNTIKFCFLEGSDSAHTRIFRSLPKKKIKNREVEAVELDSISEVKDKSCQLLFVGKRAESNALFSVIKVLNRELVTVGETRDFIEHGGMITIVPLQSKMKIFISRTQYENTALKFSSSLLKRVNFR